MLVTIREALTLMTVAGTGWLPLSQLAMRAFQAMARAEADILLISEATADQSICFATTTAAATPAQAQLQAEFASELQRREVAAIVAERDMAIVTVTNERPSPAPTFTGQVLSALDKERVPVMVMTQDSSSRLSLVIKGADLGPALRGIQTRHLSFFPGD